MATERLRLDDIPGMKSNKIFFDANIWIYLFCEIANSKEYLVRKYSKAFSEVLRSDKIIFTDIMIMSEFINRYLRIAYYNYKTINNLSAFDYKKDYRNTNDFSEALKTVYNIVKSKILPKTEIANYQYDKSSFITLLNEKEHDMDFNDTHVITVCSQNNMCLLTHDSDFRNCDVSIISCNRLFWSSKET